MGLRDSVGSIVRIAVSAVMFLVALLVGAKTEWGALSKADAPAAEDRAFAAVALGETGPDATSAELIDAAVFRGEISPEQSLLYGVYLACDPDRLPPQFRGQDPGVASRNILWEADVDWGGLSPDIRQAFGAFFAAQADAANAACWPDIRQLADAGDVWWIAALRSGPSSPDGATFAASRP
jgi:hypothetical protein